MTTIDETETALSAGTKHHTGADAEYDGEDSQAPSSAVEMTEGIGRRWRQESTGLVAGNDVSLEQIDLGCAEFRKLKFFREAGQGNSASDESTVIAYHARREGNAHGGQVYIPIVDAWWSGTIFDFGEEIYSGGGDRRLGRYMSVYVQGIWKEGVGSGGKWM